MHAVSGIYQKAGNGDEVEGEGGSSITSTSLALVMQEKQLTPSRVGYASGYKRSIMSPHYLSNMFLSSSANSSNDLDN